MKAKRRSQIALNQLGLVYEMRRKGYSMRKIGESIGRSVSTVQHILTKYRSEVSATWLGMSSYDKALHAQRCRRKRRHQRGRHKRLENAVLRRHVIKRLVNERYSPEQISNSIEKELPGYSISFKSIYNMTKHDRPELKKYLMEQGKSRRQQVVRRRGRFRQGAPQKVRISERPEIINNRSEFGHWEGDTVVSAKDGSGEALLSLRERKTKQQIFCKIPNLQSDTVLGKLRAVFHDLPVHAFKSLTLDNGPEFSASAMHKLKDFFPGVDIYYCDAYQSQQKGTVENGHRILRVFCPKGTDFANVSKEQLEIVSAKINARPIKCLGFKSQQDAFDQALQGYRPDT